MSEQPSGYVRIDRAVTAAELEQIKSRWQSRPDVEVVLPTSDPDFPDPGRYEDEYTWWGRRRRNRINAERRRQQRERRIAELECELGIACDEDPCTHWLRMEQV